MKHLRIYKVIGGRCYKTLAENDKVSGVGDGKFNPDGTVTRAEFLKMALGTVGIADVPYRSGECLDVTASDWYGGCVQVRSTKA